MPIEFLTVAEGRIAFQRQLGDDRPGILFLGGFASDMEGTKAVFLSQRAKTASLSFTRFDYRGQGKSSGLFSDATIGSKLDDSFNVFDRLTTGPQIIIGSSMGGWLGLLLAEARPDRVKAFIGISAAPDFTEELIWQKLAPAEREKLLQDKQISENRPPRPGEKPITLKLIEEARSHMVFQRPLKLSCPVRLLQGMKDKEVPWNHAERIAQHVEQEDIEVILIKNGNHGLNAPQNLDLLWETASKFA